MLGLTQLRREKYFEDLPAVCRQRFWPVFPMYMTLISCATTLRKLRNRNKRTWASRRVSTKSSCHSSLASTVGQICTPLAYALLEAKVRHESCDDIDRLLRVAYSPRPLVASGNCPCAVMRTLCFAVDHLSAGIAQRPAARRWDRTRRRPAWSGAASFSPRSIPAGEWNPTAVLVQDAHFTAEDGTKLHGWYVRHPEPRGTCAAAARQRGQRDAAGRNAADAQPAAQPGGAGARLSRLSAGAKARRASRACIRTPGRPAAGWPTPRRSPKSDMILMGFSLGGAVAIDLAAQRRRARAGAWPTRSLRCRKWLSITGRGCRWGWMLRRG